MKITEDYKEVVETIVRKVSCGKKYEFEIGDLILLKKGDNAGKVVYITGFKNKGCDNFVDSYDIHFLTENKNGWLVRGNEKDAMENGYYEYLGGKFIKEDCCG